MEGVSGGDISVEVLLGFWSRLGAPDDFGEVLS
jgi:hypothetical protein